MPTRRIILLPTLFEWAIFNSCCRCSQYYSIWIHFPSFDCVKFQHDLTLIMWLYASTHPKMDGLSHHSGYSQARETQPRHSLYAEFHSTCENCYLVVLPRPTTSRGSGNMVISFSSQCQGQNPRQWSTLEVMSRQKGAYCHCHCSGGLGSPNLGQIIFSIYFMF